VVVAWRLGGRTLDSVSTPLLSRFRRARLGYALALLLGAIATVYALATIKWLPLPAKVSKALANHSIGTSILTGGRSVPPPPSWQAAWGYAHSYFGAVLTAVIAGLVIGGAVQALVPTSFFRKVAGVSNIRATIFATLGALPVMF
jgi:uncharacterized protein